MQEIKEEKKQNCKFQQTTKLQLKNSVSGEKIGEKSKGLQ